MSETFLMSRKERSRLEIFARVKAGQLTRLRAAELLGLSYRHTLRTYDRYAECGAAGLGHGLRGRPSNHRQDLKHRRRVLALYRKRYLGFGPTLAAEQMLEQEKVPVDHETLRRMLLSEGLWKPSRQGQKHRSRRERRPCLGELVQLDGSPHAWLEDRGPRMTLVELVDDATSLAYGRFYPEETTESVMDCFGRYIRRSGVPRALYVDKDSIYTVNNREATGAEILENREPVTQFGRAAEELGVEIILAHSPQAKGRVERVHGTHQDRLVKLLRLDEIDTMESANDYLEEKYWPAYNSSFSKPAAETVDLHRKMPAELEQVLCLKEPRTVGKDWCVCYEKRVLQIAARHQSLGLAGRRVEVRHYLDGRLALYLGARVLGHEELTAHPAPEKSRPAVENRKPYKPSSEHPYNRVAAVAARAGVRTPSAAPPGPAPRKNM